MNFLSYAERPHVAAGCSGSILAGEADVITEDILLGSMNSVGPDKREELISRNVTAIVNCCPKVCPNAHEKDGLIQYCGVPVNDIESANIIPWLTPATSFMHKHISLGGKCLVHCQMGVSRSSTVVIAYLMRYYNMSRDEAYSLAKAKRSVVDPNGGFWDQLHSYQESLSCDNMPVAGHMSSSNDSCRLDEAWIESTYVSFCANNGNLAESNYFTEFDKCQSIEDANECLQTGLYFALGKGLDTYELKWYCGLANAYSNKFPVNDLEVKTNTSSQTCSQCHSSLSSAHLETLKILSSEMFADDWGSDFNSTHRSRLLKALESSHKI